MISRRIILAGGSGFIGTALAVALVRRGDDVVILTRSPGAWRGQGRPVAWDGKTLGDWSREVDGAYAVVNLAGKNVNCRYTPKNLAEVNRSRVDSVNVIAAAIAQAASPPVVLIQSSTTAIYGDRGDDWCDESTPPGEGIPVQTATQWERAFHQAPTPATRRVLLRISFVLGRNGGVFRMLSRLTRCFLGGTVGSGQQYISWIHIDDLVLFILRALEDDAIAGAYNIATPDARTNAQFMRELRRAFRRPWSPPVPAWALRIGCFLLRTEPVLALTGRRASVRRLVDLDFDFHFANLPAALKDLSR